MKLFVNDQCRTATHRWLALAFLLSAVLWISAELAGPLLRWSRPQDLFPEVTSDLDSFSQPAIAATRLRHEAERLFAVYFFERETKPRTRDAAQPEKASGEVDGATSPGVVEMARTFKSLAQLHRDTSSLKADLDCKLLAISWDLGRHSDAVSYYLELMSDAPGHVNVLYWAVSMLESARLCGREPEVLASMQTVIRSHPEIDTAPGLQVVMDEHRAKSGTSFEVSSR